jgi:hypothetical protein
VSQAAASQAAASQAGTGPAGRWQPAGQLPLAATDFSGPAAGFTGPAAELACLLGRLSGDGMAVTVVTGMLGAAKTAPGIGTCQCGRPVYLLVTGSQAAD